MKYKIKHIGEGKFDVIMEDCSIKSAGPNLCGKIRYTYFEDYTIPPINWEVTNEKLLIDYHGKVIPDIISGKIKPNIMNI